MYLLVSCPAGKIRGKINPGFFLRFFPAGHETRSVYFWFSPLPVQMEIKGIVGISIFIFGKIEN